MPTYNDLSIEEVTWSQARESIKAKDYELFQLLENISPTNEYTFIKAKYPFGAKIINHGELCLPCMPGKTLPITSSQFPPYLKKKLSYSPIPLAFLSNKACEVFMESDHRSFPLVLLSAGALFGLFEVTGLLSGIQILPEPNWCISSGARFIFMLPQINDPVGYKQLEKELGIKLTIPQSLKDHGELFIQLTNHADFIDDWQSEVFFFTDKWFESPLDDPKWAMFYSYLFKYSAQQISSSYKDPLFETLWDFSKKTILNSSINTSSYILNTIKHLIAIATGIMPGFCNAERNEEAAPIQLIQDLFLEIYGLTEYLPTIMHAYHQTKGKILRPTYYSLSFPTLFDDPENHISNNIGDDLLAIKSILNILFSQSTLKSSKLPKAYSLLDNVQYKLYHKQTNHLDSVHSLISNDRALFNDRDMSSQRNICSNSPFFDGCIQIFSCFAPHQKYLHGYRIISGK